MTPSTWLVTGCSSGLGRALAEHLLEHGHRVVVTARDPESVRHLAVAHPERARVAPLDVTNEAQVRSAVAAGEQFGGIDVLVNNAGYTYRAAVEEGEDDDIEQLLDTHLLGTIRTIRAALPGMRARRSGTIVNISSIATRVAVPGAGYYAAAKAGVEALTQDLRTEVGPLGITAFVVLPGAFRTDFAGRSLTQSARPIADYAGTAGRRRKEISVDGAQPGDPGRAAAAILEAVASGSPPAVMPLGGDAVDAFLESLQQQRREVMPWEHVSRSTDVRE